MSSAEGLRVLAVDLRAHRLGYAVLEGPRCLLDYGASAFESAATARERVRRLVTAYKPSVLVVDNGATRGYRDRNHAAAIMRAIRRYVRHTHLSIAVVPNRMLLKFLRSQGVRNKYEFAVLAATWFPQLASRVKPNRKCYNPEPLVMICFDALALAVAYLAQ